MLNEGRSPEGIVREFVSQLTDGLAKAVDSALRIICVGLYDVSGAVGQFISLMTVQDSAAIEACSKKLSNIGNTSYKSG